MPDRSELADRLGRWLVSTTFPEPGSRVVCAVSGGADSLALLGLAVAAGCDVVAMHVDHGQRPESRREAGVVEAAAHTVGAGFLCRSVDVAPGPNLEARMRAARYRVVGPEACTGHTMDDQAETVLINLMRGAGLVGLGAMQPGPRRPILGLRRADTQMICSALGWDPVVDPTNADRSFSRNRIRAELIPLLNEIARRDVVPLLARSAGHCRSAAALVDELAATVDPTDARQLDVAAVPVAGRAIQSWVRTATGAEHPIDQSSVERVLRVAEGVAVAAEINGGWRVSRSGGRLRIT